eukprot:GHUV01018348.1.p2 GENE.GHUV01018348.1~~GHUV01018348.1.p2  ORF type:complete len:101 (-),score=3.72 GHUV01018348.1:1566-1868(-)
MTVLLFIPKSLYIYATYSCICGFNEIEVRSLTRASWWTVDCALQIGMTVEIQPYTIAITMWYPLLLPTSAGTLLTPNSPFLLANLCCRASLSAGRPSAGP